MLSVIESMPPNIAFERTRRFRPSSFHLRWRHAARLVVRPQKPYGTGCAHSRWLWFVAPLGLLSYEIWEGVHTAFLGFGFYFAAWGGLLALSICGGWFLIGMPGAKWVLRVAAIVVALYVLLMFLIAWSNAPYYGGHDFLFYGCLWVVIALCVASCFIAGRRAA